MLHTSTATTTRRSRRTPSLAANRPRMQVGGVGADPVDVATVRALWCALHPDAPVGTIVDELVDLAAGRTEVIQQAMHRIRSGRLERSAWVNGPALAVLELALAKTLVRSEPRAEATEPTSPEGTKDPGAARWRASTMAS